MYTQVNRAVGTANARLDHITWLQVLRAAFLGLEEQLPFGGFRHQGGDTLFADLFAEYRRRYPNVTIQLLEGGKFDRLSTFYTSECAEPGDVYAAYERDLMIRLEEVSTISPGFRGGIKPAAAMKSRRLIQQLVPMWAKDIARRFMRY